GGGNTLVGKLEQKINGNPFNIANYSYDHLNRVVVKDGRACMTLNEYNIRGFLTHIAAEDHSQPTISRFFDERLRYEWGFRDKHYNGNIAGITWSGGDGKRHAYGYTYDSLDRLTHAEHRHLSGGNWVNTDWNYTASNISYDLNGNIKTMNQKGGSYPGAAQNMDILSYQYGSNSNQLQSVEDAGTAISGLPDFRNGVSQAIEYTYDQNGNMTRDDNKGLTVSYNHLNKPAAITVSGKGSIYYTYDAGGNLLRKKLDSAGVITLYDYFGNFVYKSDVLQYITNEEGRARPIANDTTAHLTRFVYDYFVKDHLGNVRSTVTAEPINRDYLARHEMATAGAEQLVFDNIPNVRESKPGSTNPGDGMAARLEGGNPNTQVGTAIMLKVMPGDKFEISADSYYEGENQTQEESGAGPVISSLMNALMGGGTYAGTPVSELPDNLKTISGLLSNPVLPEQLRGLQSNDNPMVPKAHINYLFFDSKMQLVTDLSGSIQVQGGGPSGWHNSGSVTIGPGVVGNNVIQPSYVIIYIDNQTIGKNVWFDNMRVEHYTSKLLEEDHYYPFGLTVGIDQAAQTNLPEQPYKYQGIELERHFGLEMYETFYRGLDPQLGRFMQVDPKAEAGYSMSPYVAMDNNPVSKIDPLGDLAGDGNGDKEKPSAFATGVATLMNAIGIIGRGTAPPWTETGSRNGKNPQNAKELVEDFKSGVDMMMLLGAPLQMLSAESALPAKVESKAIESELSMAPRAAEGGLKITVAEEVGESMVRVRHHTSAAGLKGIKSSMSINASRGKPYGVDVEVAPFVKPSEANMGQAGKGAYTEFSVQKSQLSPIKGYMGGNGNAARIVTEGAPLKINNADPKFIKWDWFNFGSH
ncbi:RHS repeat protein, partial [Taibaiella chishuiensis]